jgi:hypothetical protein
MRYMFVGILLLTGCAPVIWDKPGITQAQFAQEDARCRLVARGMNPGGFYAQGSASFVAGAAVGNAIGTAVATNATYRDCMVASGYTAESPQLQASVEKAKPVLAELTSCATAIYSSPEAEPIRRRVAFIPAETTPAQLADPALASAQEIAVADTLVHKLRGCQQAAIRGLSASAPPIVPIIQSTIAATEGDLTLLKAGKMTWGEYNTRRRDRAFHMQEQVTTELHGST